MPEGVEKLWLLAVGLFHAFNRPHAFQHRFNGPWRNSTFDGGGFEACHTAAELLQTRIAERARGHQREEYGHEHKKANEE